ncbi:MAG: hypothetical protein ACJ8D5_04480 [Sphingomicrobium sp.]
MDIRFSLIASTVLALATAAAAEPPKAATGAAAQPQSRPAAVVLASAEPVQTPQVASQELAPVPAKRPRAARVTTCRCGDQTAPTQH